MTKDKYTTWQKMKLGDVATLHRGYDLPVDDIQIGSHPVIFANGAIEYHDEYKIAGPGVITGRSGTLGNVFYIENNFWPHNTTLYVSDFHDNNPRFIYYLLQRLDLARLNGGSGVPTLNRNHAHDIEVEIPDNVNEQKRIAEFLRAFDDKIEINNKIIKNLEELSQTIFKEWFVKFKFPGYEKVTTVDSELGKILKGWKVGPLLEVADVIKGQKPKEVLMKHAPGSIEYLLIDSLTGGVPLFTKDLSIPQSNRTDSLIIMDGASSGRILNGKIGAVGSTLAVVRSRKEISSDFVNLFLKQIEPVLRGNLTGSAIPHVDNSLLKKYPIPIPTDDILKLFSSIVRPMLEHAKGLAKESATLSQTRDLFLPKIMKGEIKV